MALTTLVFWISVFSLVTSNITCLGIFVYVFPSLNSFPFSTLIESFFVGACIFTCIRKPIHCSAFNRFLCGENNLECNICALTYVLWFMTQKVIFLQKLHLLTVAPDTAGPFPSLISFSNFEKASSSPGYFFSASNFTASLNCL